MRFEYYPETDSMYLTLRDSVGVDVFEINDEFCVDLDSAGFVVGLDIQHASEMIDLSKFEVKGFLSPTFVNQHEV